MFLKSLSQVIQLDLCGYDPQNERKRERFNTRTNGSGFKPRLCRL